MACGRTEGAETVWDPPRRPVSRRVRALTSGARGARRGVLVALGLGTLRVHTKRRRMVIMINHLTGGPPAALK